MNIVINAGGTGTRLWPVSTKANPKQFAKILDTSLIRMTFDRLITSFDLTSIWVVCNKDHKHLVQRELPELPISHILIEETKWDTYAAIISQAAIVASKTSRQEPLVFVQADSYIPKADWPTYNHALKSMATAVLQDTFKIINNGIKPTFPSTQLEYIHLDTHSNAYSKVFDEAVQVHQIIKRPDAETAQQFFESQDYLWNYGQYCFSFDTLTELLAHYDPKSLPIVEKFYTQQSITQDDLIQLPQTSIEYGLTQHIKTELGVVGMNISWQDFGTWEIVAEHLPKPETVDTIALINAHNNIIKSTNPDKKIGIVGLSNIIVIDTPEGLLVCAKDEFAQTKEIAGILDT